MNYSKTIKDIEKNYDERKTKRLKEMSRYYKIDKKDENKIIYEVFIKKYSPIQLGLTVINPGTVNKEYYMTSGHIHKKKIPEFYILMEGSGILLIQKDNKFKEIKMKKGEINFIPEGYAHRIINTGTNKFKVLTIYHEDSKPDFNVKFKKRFFKR